MPLLLPNTITNGIPVDGDKLGQNFASIQAWAGTDIINADGSVPMTGPLLLPGNPTQPKQAATKEYVDATVPIGAFFMWGGTTAPTNYLLCQGQNVPRSTYAKLFAVFGVLYGPGDGTTTFALPQMRGRMPMGYYPSGAWAETLGEQFGSANAALVTHTHPMPHTHSIGHNHPSATSSTNSHDHDIRGAPDASAAGGFGEFNAADAAATSFSVRGQTGARSHNHTVDVPAFAGNSGGSSAANTSAPGGAVAAANANIPPVVVVNFIVKAL